MYFLYGSVRWIMTKNRKIETFQEKHQKHRKGRVWLCAVLAAVLLCCLLPLLVTYIQDSPRREKLAKLSQYAYGYDETTLILRDTDREEAEAFAQRLGASMRTNRKGDIAFISLPKGMTVRDVYEDDANLAYLSRLDANYYVKLSDFNVQEPSAVLAGQSVQDITGETYYSQQGYLKYIGLGDVQDRTMGDGVTVAIIDTGLDYDHPEFTGKISPYSYNASTDQIVADSASTAAGGQVVYDWSIIDDAYGHGTAAAGVIAAQLDGAGIGGIAPEAELLIVKMETDENGYNKLVDILIAMEYVALQSVDVVNMSWGLVDAEDLLTHSIEQLEAQGIVCVAAAGNEGVTTPNYPAAHPTVIGVGALAPHSWRIDKYSNRGENVDVVAPGTVYTTEVGGGYATVAGTSFATPVVTAAVALYKSLYQDATPAQVREALYTFSKDLGDAGYDDTFGYGALNIYAFVQDTTRPIADQTDFKVSTVYEMYRDQLPLVRHDAIEVFATAFNAQINLISPVSYPAELMITGTDSKVFEDYFGDYFNVGGGAFYYEGLKNPDDSADANLWRDVLEYTFTVPADGEYELVFLACGDLTDADRGFSYSVDGGNISQINCTKTKGVFENRVYQTTAEALEKTKENANSASYMPAYYYGLSITLSAGTHTLQFYPLLQDAQGNAHRGGNHNMELISFYVQPYLSEDALESYEYPYKRPVKLPESTGLVFEVYNDGSCSVLSIGTYTGKRLVIPQYAPSGDPVTRIDDRAFANSSIISVVIPASVTEIDDDAFKKCENLRSVTFLHDDDDTITFGSGAFESCSKLLSVEFNMNVEGLGKGTFYWCTSLERVVLPDNVTDLGSAFHYCLSLKEINIPKSVKRVSGFYACKSLESIEIPEGVEVVGDFGLCSNLKSIVLPDTVTTIEANAFAFCDSLEEIVIPDSVTVIGKEAFESCDLLREIHIPDGVTRIAEGVFWNCSSLQKIIIPQGVTIIDATAFQYCHSLTSLRLPASIQKIGEKALSDCKNLKDIYIESPNVLQGLTSADAQGNFCPIAVNILVPKNLQLTGSYVLGTFTYVEDVWVDGKEYMCFSNHAHTWSAYQVEAQTCLTDGFDGWKCTTCQLTSGSVVSCHNWNEVDIGQTCAVGLVCADCGAVSPVGRTKHEYQLTQTFTHTCTEMGKECYVCTKCLAETCRYTTLAKGHAWSTTHVCPDCSTELATEIVYDVSINQDRTMLATIYTLRPLGEYALEIVGVGEMKDYGWHLLIPWYDSEYLTKISTAAVGEGVVSLSPATFYGQTALTDVSLPGTLKKAGLDCFMGCDSLITIALPEGFEEMGAEMFGWCDSLTTVYLPDSLKVISHEAFIACGSLNTIRLPDGTVEICRGAFKNSGLTEITLPEALQTVGPGAFEGCESLKSVTFCGGNPTLEDSVFADCTALESITFPGSVSSIGEGAFWGCTALQSIRLPEGITVVSGNMFADCTALESVVLPTTVLTIGESAFSGCSALENVQISSALTTVEKLAFYACTFLKKIELPHSVTSIGAAAFSGCTSLTEMRVPVGVTTIEANTFSGCSSLTSIVLSDAVSSIGERAFDSCVALPSIVLPDALSELGTNAFNGCVALTEINIPPMLDDIVQNKPFKGCTALVTVYVYNPELIRVMGGFGSSIPSVLNVLLPTDTPEIDCIKLSAYPNACTLVQNGQSFLCQSKCEHTWESGEQAAITCQSDGFAGSTCTSCGLWDGQRISAHNWQKVAIGTTCQAYFVCTDCGARDTAYVSEHQYELLATVVPTCVSFGYSTCICKECGVLHRKDQAGPLGHSYTLELEVLAPTCRDEGYTRMGCERCDSTKHINVLPALGHAYTVQKEVVAPTCTKNGYTLYGCARCDSTSKQDIIWANGHAWDGSDTCPACGQAHVVAEQWNVAGQEGDSITATLYSLGNASSSGRAYALCIVGAGQLIDWTSYTAVPWYNYRKYIQEVTLDDRLTSIGNYAFYEFSKVNHLNMPLMTEKIGAFAFYRCQGIATQGWSGEKVKQIGRYAFAYSDICGKIIITAESIGDNAFAYSNIEQVDMSGALQITKIEYDTFNACANLTEIVLPPMLVSIYNDAFYACSSLKYVIIPATVTDIRNQAFGMSPSLVVGFAADRLPANLDDAWGTVGIKTVLNVSEFVLQDDFLFVKHHNSDVTLVAYYGSDKTVQVPASIDGLTVTAIGKKAFSGCSALRAVMLPDTVIEIGEQAFSLCPNAVLCFAGARLPSKLGADWRGNASYCLGAVGVILENEQIYAITKDGNALLAGYFGDAPQYTLAQSVNGYKIVGIGSYAFQDAAPLKEIVLHSGVTCIAEYAFYGQGNALIGFAAQVLPETLGASWNAGARYFTGVREFAFEEDATFVIYADNTATLLTYFGGAASYIVPSDISGVPVTEIGEKAFAGCTGLTEIIWNDALCKIGAYAFDSCYGLTSLVLPEGLVTIGDYAFSSCLYVTKLILPESLSSVGANAFDGCSRLVMVQILSPQYASSLTSKDTWLTSSNIDCVMVPKSAQSSYLASCYSVSINVVYPEGEFVAYSDVSHTWESAVIESVPCKQAGFTGEICTVCGLMNGTFTVAHNWSSHETEHACTTKQICVDCGAEQLVFDHTYQQTGITPPTCTQPGDTHSACIFCGLEKTEQTQAALGHQYSAALTCIRCGTSAEVLQSYDVSTMVDGSVMVYIFQQGDGTYEMLIRGTGAMRDYTSGSSAPWYTTYRSQVQHLTVSQGITHIGSYAFYNCAFEQIVLPSSLSSIGRYAFHNCDLLSEVILPDGLVEIGNNAFYSCDALARLRIPASLTTVGSAAFMNCSNLKTVYVSSETVAGLLTSTTTAGWLLQSVQSVAIASDITNIPTYVLNQYPKTCTVSYGGNTYTVYSKCDHSMSQVSIDAITCLTDGFEGYVCSLCGIYNGQSKDCHQWQTQIFEDECYQAIICVNCKQIKQKTPKHSFTVKEKVEATCLAGGYTVYQCTKCGETEQKDQTAPLAHEYSVFVQTIAPTCTEQGYTLYQCVSCQTTQKTDYTQATGHTYTTVLQTIAPTCTEQGYTLYQCASCQTTQKTDYTQATGHTYTTVIQTIAPTCTEQGYTVYRCADCSALVEKEFVAAKGHSYDESKTCTVCGQKMVGLKSYVAGELVQAILYDMESGGGYVLVFSGQGDMYSFEIRQAPWYSDRLNIKKVVVEQGVTSIGAYAFYRFTDLTEVVFADSVCKIEEYAFDTCLSLPAITLPYADCEIASNAFRSCTMLKEVTFPEQISPDKISTGAFQSSSMIRTLYLGSAEQIAFLTTSSALGNALQYAQTVVVAADVQNLPSYFASIYSKTETFTYNGENLIAYSRHVHSWSEHACIKEQVPCVSDGEYVMICMTCYVKKTSVVAAHRIYQYKEKAPTCTMSGYPAYEICFDCSYTTYQEIAPLGHSYGDWEIIFAPTCTRYGEQVRVCSTCANKEYHYPESLDHNPGVEATCTTAQTCTMCGTTIKDKLGHTEVIEAAVAPTCSEPGMTEGKHCSVCSEVLVAQKEVAALGHTVVVDASVVPTCSEPGLTEGKHCSVCSEVLVAQNVVDGLGQSRRPSGLRKTTY